MTKFYANIRGEMHQGDLKWLSECYCEIRDESGEGCSTFRPVNVYISGTTEAIGHISYNGRVWDQPLSNKFDAFTGFLDTSKLLYDNRLPPVPPASVLTEILS
jgi:hypothetical protein